MALNDLDSMLGVEWTSKAKSDLAKLAKRDSDRIRRAVARFAQDGSGNVKRLQGGEQPYFRPRVGEWRVRFHREAGIVRILRVLQRREAYRKSAWIHQDALGPDSSPEAWLPDGPAS